MKLRQKQLNLKVKAIDETNFTIDGVFSTAMEDRQGEVVDQKGWDLTEFLLNPVVLFAHDHFTPAVGKVLEIGLDEGGNLAGKIQFAVGSSPLADTLWKLYSGGFMKAFSAGFMNLDLEIDQENEQLILRKNKLYEMSCVNVPANALALAKGIDLAPIEGYQQKQAELMDIQQKNLEKVETALKEKEGRVLSKKNRDILQTAHDALGEVLKTDAEDEKIEPAPVEKINEPNPSSDTTETVNPKVETPQSPVGGAKKSKKVPTKKQINKAIRELLQKKKLI